jgi:hypothetical protein
MNDLATQLYTVGSLAHHFGVKPWQVRRLFSRGFLPAAARLGPSRVFSADDLPAVEDALRRAGYLPGEDEPSTAPA